MVKSLVHLTWNGPNVRAISSLVSPIAMLHVNKLWSGDEPAIGYPTAAITRHWQEIHIKNIKKPIRDSSGHSEFRADL